MKQQRMNHQEEKIKASIISCLKNKIFQKTSEAEERRLKELEDQVSRKQKELEECRVRAREKSVKQRIEEAEATLCELNEQLQSASHEDVNIEDPNSATNVSQEKISQKSFVSIDTSSPLSINLQLGQWPLGYKFNMIPSFDGQSDPRQFLMSFEAAIISRGDETTLAQSLVIAVRGPAQQWYSSLKAKSIQSCDHLKANFLVDFQGFQPVGLTHIDLFNCKQ
jgi:hypothetical protein